MHTTTLSPTSLLASILAENSQNSRFRADTHRQTIINEINGLVEVPR